MSKAPCLLAGLGNPGDRYRFTRHNIGFMALDRLAGDLELAFEAHGRQSVFCRTGSGGVFCKPLTYMNRSGIALRLFLEAYDLEPRDCLVSRATGVLGTHVGIGAWAVFYQVEDGTPEHPGAGDGVA